MDVFISRCVGHASRSAGRNINPVIDRFTAATAWRAAATSALLTVASIAAVDAGVSWSAALRVGVGAAAVATAVLLVVSAVWVGVAVVLVVGAAVIVTSGVLATAAVFGARLLPAPTPAHLGAVYGAAVFGAAVFGAVLSWTFSRRA